MIGGMHGFVRVLLLWFVMMQMILLLGILRGAPFGVVLGVIGAFMGVIVIALVLVLGS